MTQPLTPPHAVRLRGIVKRFGDFVANSDVDLAVRPGSVHAVVGENGAGKSTLMKILSGELAPDEGTIEIDGEPVQFRSPRQAQRAGVGIVHQHFLLADAMTVWENVVLADEPGGPIVVDRRAATSRVAALAAENGFDLDVHAEIGSLGVGDRQRVEILKVLYRDANVIILDEPTAVLVPAEAEALFESARRLTERGAAVVFISHKLDEVLAFADDITVIRRGQVVGTTTAAETTAAELASLMVGGETPQVQARTTPVGDRVVLRTVGLTVAGRGARPALDSVDLDVHAGEILGVAGIEGNGQTELLEALLGRVQAEGSVILDGQDVTRLSTRRRRDRGIGYVPEDRHRDGVVLDMTMAHNAALGYVHRPAFNQRGWFRARNAREEATTIIDRFDVRGGGAQTPARSLSGGNQQKFIVGRELLASPRLLLAAHPTRGVDIGAQAAIWGELLEARAAGLATLLISADLDELLTVSDRLIVMYDGRIVADVDPTTVTKHELGAHMTGIGETAGAA